ncbi:MAG TPA: hypothetical protein PLL77_10835 [Pyrinomonadaceae bacterium]|nr:hypothetical protein [Pyrinomonadaceae bacterium]
MSKKYSNDDKTVCATGGSRAGDTFCDYFKQYKDNETANPILAANARDNMLFILKREVDDYYEEYKVGRAKKTKWFQTVLDILGIGLSLSGTMVNGVRPKTWIGAVSGSFQAGRDSVNDRFNLLQIKILTNKMDSNRLEKWAEILAEMNKNAADFRWDKARSLLQEYTVRGTFENALDSLVNETGSEVTEGEKKVLAATVAGAVPKAELDALLDNFNTFIKPMWERGKKFDTDITAKAAEIAAKAAGDPALPALTQELADLQAGKANLMTNYKNIWDAIVIGGELELIEKRINDKYSAFPAVTGAYTAAKTKIVSNVPSAPTHDDYYLVLSKMNAIVGGDPELNKMFTAILKKYVQ